MQQENGCDVCGEPATHFFDAVQCFTDGRPNSSTSIQLCAVHADAHEQKMARETLDSMLRSWRGVTTAAEPTDFVEIVFDVEGEADAAQLAADLGRTFGGDAQTAEWPDGRKVVWRLPATVSAIDQWQCEGWSQRVLEMARRGGCELNGFGIDVRRP